jgi:uncharacterized RDD family membrane protein YckC
VTPSATATITRERLGQPAATGSSAGAREPGGGAALPLAQRWRRLLAFVIDCLILTLATGALWGRLIAAFVNRMARYQASFPDASAPGASAAYDRVYTHILGPYLIELSFTICVAVVYYWLLTGYWGTTIGKRCLGMWVVMARDGSKVGLPASFARALTFVLGGEVIPLFFAVDNLWLLWDRRRQCLHDKVARTVVVTTAVSRRSSSGRRR